MNRDKSFWLSLGAFILFFGSAIFFATRQIYSNDSDSSAGTQVGVGGESTAWNDQFPQISPEVLNTLVPADDSLQDPSEISNRANEYFAAKNYAKSAVLYERLVNMDPRNGDSYNNLGITLHYLGRSTEAIQWLEAGSEMDASNQRLWLTLGFVRKEIGETEAARSALSTALEIDADTDVGQSAARFLSEMSDNSH